MDPCPSVNLTTDNTLWTTYFQRGPVNPSRSTARGHQKWTSQVHCTTFLRLGEANPRWVNLALRWGKVGDHVGIPGDVFFLFRLCYASPLDNLCPATFLEEGPLKSLWSKHNSGMVGV